MKREKPAFHRTIVIADVENYTDPARTNTHQLAVRRGFYQGMPESFRRAGIPWDQCSVDDRGDGALILIPPEVPKSLLVTRLPARLTYMLVRYNTAHPAPERMRLRIAFHAGEVHQDSYGFAGSSLNLAFRLVEEPAYKIALRRSRGVAALIVSDWFFDEVVRHHPTAEPSCFRQMPVVVAGADMTAWVRLLEAAEGFAPPAGQL